MLSSFDKALVPFVASAIAWLNQKYGFGLDADPAAVGVLIGAITSIIVYFVPNKPAATPASK